MKKWLWLIFFPFSLVSWGQEAHFTVEYPLVFEQEQLNQVSWEWDIPLEKNEHHDFFALSVVLEGISIHLHNVQVWIDTGSGWGALPRFSEELVSDHWISELVFFNEISCRLKVLLPPATPLPTGKIRIFSPSGALSSSQTSGETVWTPESCPCPQPTYIPRSQWGSAWNLNSNIYIPPAVYTNVTHLIVHHSAGTNTSNNWKGVVAAIFDYHVNTNGWSDVGYNWLIDPNGALYEGRGGGNNVRGAHMCGYNNNTMGVCLLGNFVNVAPGNQAMETLKRLLAWKCCDSDIAPLESSPITSYLGIMKHISGHQDGCAPGYTECPGGLLHSMLPSMRLAVSDYLSNHCNSTRTEEPLQDAILVWPNPSSTGRWRLAYSISSISANLYLRDLRQGIIYSTVLSPGTNEQTIEMEGVAAGIYFVEIQYSTGKTMRKKIILSY